MTAVTRDDYIRLKNEILLNTRNYTNNEQNLAVLKHRYENEINSVRKFSQIKNLVQLVNMLEKRDCVSENDITILEEIGRQIGNNQFLAELSNLRRNETGERDLNPVNSRSIPIIAPQIGGQSPAYDMSDVHRRVYDAIATEIGNKWIDFARYLKLAESKIDKLKIDTNNNSELCARAVLEFHKNNVHPREWKSKMLQALEKARRNDLKEKVNGIFDDFSYIQ